MKKSLFRKYFLTCTSLIVVSIGILGLALLLFSSQSFKQERYHLLSSNAQKAVQYMILTGQNKRDVHDIPQQPELQAYLALLSDAINGTMFFVTPQGVVLTCTEPFPCQHTQHGLSDNILAMLEENGKYLEVGNLGGMYDAHHYTVGVPVMIDGMLIGYIFCSSDATAPLETFLIDVFKMFLISASLVVVVVCAIIYFVTYQLVQPLKEMSQAAQKFGNGDFSARLPVHSYDEMGQLAMALNNMAESLSTLEFMRRTFISNVSHELKTPMQTIGGFVDGILDHTIPPEQEKRYLRIVSQEIKRLSRIVRTMLDLSRIEAGETALHSQPVEIVNTICTTLFSLEHQVEQKNLEILGLDHDKVYVEADPDLIHQVVYNLTENAIKFSPEGGYISFSFTKEGSKMLIGIKNSGDGIDKEEIPRVFDRFYKTDQSRGQNKDGVGLGLYIVRSIVSLHGGEIIVRSVKNEYCEFLFSLPLARPRLQNKLRKTEPHKSDAGKLPPSISEPLKQESAQEPSET